MKRAVLAGVIIGGLLLSTTAWSEDLNRAHQRRGQINSLSAVIMETDFEPVRLTVVAATEKEAFVEVAARARDYVKSHRLCFLMDLCLNTVKMVTNGEYALARQWQDGATLEESSDGVRLSVELNDKQLTQMALYNMWPLFYESSQVRKQLSIAEAVADAGCGTY